nr:unnamed protein product [Callosobruchus chinensis]
MQCLRNKTEVVEIELAKYKVDIFCVSEHWLNEDQVQACTIQGYQLASMYYRSSCKNGGVGDWNVDFSSNSLEKNLIQDTLSSFGFQNIVGEATRVSQKSATAIDYVCLNVEQSDYSLSVIFNDFYNIDKIKLKI